MISRRWCEWCQFMTGLGLVDPQSWSVATYGGRLRRLRVAERWISLRNPAEKPAWATMKHGKTWDDEHGWTWMNHLPTGYQLVQDFATVWRNQWAPGSFLWPLDTIIQERRASCIFVGKRSMQKHTEMVNTMGMSANGLYPPHGYFCWEKTIFR